MCYVFGCWWFARQGCKDTGIAMLVSVLIQQKYKCVQYGSSSRNKYNFVQYGCHLWQTIASALRNAHVTHVFLASGFPHAKIVNGGGGTFLLSAALGYR